MMTNSKMRNNINKLISSGITAHTVAVDTGLPRNTVYRIFSGETDLNNVKFSTMEELNKYYLEEVWVDMNIESLDKAIEEFNDWKGAARIYLDTDDGYFETNVYHNTMQMESNLSTSNYVVVFDKEDERRNKKADKDYILRYSRLVLDGWDLMQAMFEASK